MKVDDNAESVELSVLNQLLLEANNRLAKQAGEFVARLREKDVEIARLKKETEKLTATPESGRRERAK